MKIIPSLVEHSASDLFDRITFLSPFYSQFQVDIEDGLFIKNKTFSTQEFIDQANSSSTSTLLNATVFDFHFMSKDYEHSIELIEKIKTHIHIDAVLVHTALHPKYSHLQKKYPTFRIGLVINPEEEVASINAAYDLTTVPLIQLMTIHPGPQGQSFMPEELNKIEQLRKCGFQGSIYIDGAVNEATLPFITSLSYKPDVLCPGSYLAKSPKEELAKRVSFLESHINSLSTV